MFYHLSTLTLQIFPLQLCNGYYPCPCPACIVYARIHDKATYERPVDRTYIHIHTNPNPYISSSKEKTWLLFKWKNPYGYVSVQSSSKNKRLCYSSQAGRHTRLLDSKVDHWLWHFPLLFPSTYDRKRGNILMEGKILHILLFIHFKLKRQDDWGQNIDKNDHRVLQKNG